jgi:ADP-heptose:LPS heptosyltransferase
MLSPMTDKTSHENEPRPIAVLVDREGLGDSLLKFPFLRAIRRGFPGRPIWWIATHQTSMADELAPFVTGLIDRVMPYAGLTGRSTEVRQRLKALPPFDKVFEARTHIASVLLARRLLTTNEFYCYLPGYLLSDKRPPNRWTRPPGVAERMLSLAEAALGGPADWQGTLDVSAAASALAEERLPTGPRYIGLAIGSREVRKNWPLERYIALAQGLAATGRSPVFLIGPQERETLARLRAEVPFALYPEATPPDPSLGLARLEFAIALCHRLTAAVANDSGIGHLLGAIGTPLVTLFGPTDAARWAPFTRAGIIVKSQEFGRETMEAIPVDAVLRALDRLPSAGGSQ